MRPFKELSEESISKIRYVLFDIDDTITTHGKLTSEAYDAVWKLYDSGYYPIPVTGRPAGWCDLIIRQWPVSAIIGENGAFVYYYDGNELRQFTHPSVASGDYRIKLDAIKEKVLRDIPLVRVAKDQFSRIYDLAIDFNEDEPRLGLDVAEKIKDICVSMGAEAKVSSIHVNTWFGQYDKLSMALLFMKEILGISQPKDEVLFFGDSPNDEPMFKYFTKSCGVANIRPFAATMEHLPSFVAEQESGKGFAESVEYLLSFRRR